MNAHATTMVPRATGGPTLKQIIEWLLNGEIYEDYDRLVEAVRSLHFAAELEARVMAVAVATVKEKM